jgi:lipopolysaccharide export LptBFGC system permease protein LptF
MLLYSLPFMLTFIIPMSVLLAALIAFGKLSHDNEILAIRASGVPILKMLRPLFLLITLLCLFSLILSDQIASDTHYRYRRVLKTIGIENPSAVLEEGTFIKKFKNFVIFIYEINRNKLEGIRIYQPQEGKPTRTIIASKGELISIPEQGIVKLKLIHGTSDEPDPNDPSKVYKLNFRTYDFPLNLSTVNESKVLSKKPKDMTIREIKAEIARLAEEGIRVTSPLAAEIHHKYAIAFSSLAFFLVGVPLGISARRRQRSIHFGISLVLMTSYWVLLIAGKAVAEKGLFSPWLSLQFANILMGSFGIYLFSRLVKD